MTDAAESFRPLDPGRINLMDPFELQYWCHELRCTAPELEAIVSAVGDHIAAVRQQLAASRQRCSGEGDGE